MATRAWNAGYETNPPASQDISEGAARITELKLDTRERGEVEHEWGADETTNSEGEHLAGSAKAFNGTADPANLEASGGGTGRVLDAGDDGRLLLRTDMDDRLKARVANAWSFVGSNAMAAVDYDTSTHPTPITVGAWTPLQVTGGGADFALTIATPADVSSMALVTLAQAQVTGAGSGSVPFWRITYKDTVVNETNYPGTEHFLTVGISSSHFAMAWMAAPLASETYTITLEANALTQVGAWNTRAGVPAGFTLQTSAAAMLLYLP